MNLFFKAKVGVTRQEQLFKVLWQLETITTFYSEQFPIPVPTWNCFAFLNIFNIILRKHSKWCVKLEASFVIKVRIWEKRKKLGFCENPHQKLVGFCFTEIPVCCLQGWNKFSETLIIFCLLFSSSKLWQCSHPWEGITWIWHSLVAQHKLILKINWWICK